MPAARVITLGCKVNQCDGEEIARGLQALGFEVAGPGEAAEVYVVNTCTVTATADAKARKLIHKLAREQPEAVLLVTGCYAERDPEVLAAIPGVGGVVGIAEAIQGLVPGRLAGGGVKDGKADGRRRGSPRAPALREARVRAFVKVQDGCGHGCAYCVVPQARGRPRSKPLAEVVEEVARLAGAGAQEVVLCGIRLGAYGREGSESSLAALLRQLREVDIPRLRLSSLEPMDVGDDLLAETADHPRLCHHFHLPLQSGDDQVLGEMGRGYTTGQFHELVAHIREVRPGAAISTDAMVGFPGETEEQFQQTARFLRELGFSRVHVFPYSPRPGTPAADRSGQVSAPEKGARADRLLALGAELAQQAAEAWVGRKVSVLFEERDARGRLTGLTEHYVRVRCQGPEAWLGRIAEVTPKYAEQGELLA